MEVRETLATLIQSCLDPDPKIRPPANEIYELLGAVCLFMVMSCERFTRLLGNHPALDSGWTRFVIRHGRFSGLSEFCTQIFRVVSTALWAMSHPPFFPICLSICAFPLIRT